jgi:hypothetical protein
MRDSGATDWATSCVLLAVGRPVPMSRNWRIPSSRVRCVTARTRNARAATAISTMCGFISLM